MEEIDFGFEHPRNTIISGPTSSGKSVIVGKILSHADSLFTPVPSKRILFYRENQPLYDAWIQNGILDEKCEGMPDRSDFLAQLAEHRDKGGCLVFFDDFSNLIEENKDDFQYYFTIGSHHYNASMFLIIHSLFSPALRILSLNTHRFILTKSPRDLGQVRTLASQAFPGRTAFVLDSFEDATEERYGFLILDFSPNCDKRLRLIGNIFTSSSPSPSSPSSSFSSPPFPPSVYQYKSLNKSASSKMEKNYRKQALIPWAEYLRLRAKVDACNDIERHKSSNGQNMSNQTKVHVFNDPRTSPTYHGTQPSEGFNKDSWQYSARQPEADSFNKKYSPELDAALKTSALPTSVLQPSDSELRFDSPSVEGTGVEIGKTMPLGRSTGTIPKTLKKVKTKNKKALLPYKSSTLLPQYSYPLQTRDSSTLSNNHISHNVGPLPLSNSSYSTHQLQNSQPVPMDQDTTLQSIPTSPVKSMALGYQSSDISMPSLLPSSTALVSGVPSKHVPSLLTSSTSLVPGLPSNNEGSIPSIEYSTSKNTALPLEYKPETHGLSHNTLLALKYKPDTRGSDGKKKMIAGPLRAIENVNPLPVDTAYPSSLIRDPDVEESPAVFPTKKGGRKKRPLKPLVRGSLFRPSPPISDLDDGGVGRLGKRKNSKLARPKPTAPKINKVNRGEKRMLQPQGSRGVNKKLMKATDYDLWHALN